MKYIALFLGISLMLFGCLDYFRFEPAGPPQEINTTPEPPRTAYCVDGTSSNSCSSTKPLYCTNSGALISDPEYCGCPDGTILQGAECVPLCSDGTAPERCSANRPFYCTADAQLVEKASQCGCPSGGIRSNDTCMFLCTDGTTRGSCSSSKPLFCTDQLTLMPEPERCGCPSGTVLRDDECLESKCVDGTLVGECAATPPNYCNESLQITSNPGKCGCNMGRVPTPDGMSCAPLRGYAYREDNDFEPTPGITMMVRNSEHRECDNGDYVLFDLSITNNKEEPIRFSEADIPMLQVFEVSGYKWHSVEYPVNDSECSEPAKFAFGTIQPGERAAGIVWYKLITWQSTAIYYAYYKGSGVRLDP